MKQKLGTFLIIAVFAGLFIYMAVTSTLDLTNKKDVHTVRLAGAFELLEVKHTINGLIPIGKDHYYVGIDADTQDSYVIKASKKWYEKNFGSDYNALDTDGVTITALSKKISDHDTLRAVESNAANLKGLVFPLGVDHSLELDYKSHAVKQLILVALSLFVVILGFFVLRNKGTLPQIVVRIWIGALLVWIIVFIRAIMLL